MSKYFRRYQGENGFTITELTIAMAFLTILMFILLASAMQMVSVFNKGLTLKRVNQSGRAIGAELQSSLRRTNADQSDAVTAKQKPLGVTPVDTRACTGTYSYIWDVNGNGITTGEEYTDGAPVGFAKIFDADGDFCKDLTKKPEKSKSLEMLADGLVIRQPVSFSATPDSRLTTFIYTISTPDIGDLLFDATGRSSCRGGSTRDFCALNTFIVTVYSKGI